MRPAAVYHFNNKWLILLPVIKLSGGHLKKIELWKFNHIATSGGA